MGGGEGGRELEGRLLELYKQFPLSDLINMLWRAGQARGVRRGMAHLRRAEWEVRDEERYEPDGGRRE